MRPADLDVLIAELNKRADALAKWLLPNGRQEGKFWSTSNISDAKSGTYSFKVNTETGTWADYAKQRGERGATGDMLELVSLVRYGGRKGDAIAWARSTLGYDTLDPERLATIRAEHQRTARQASQKAVQRAEWIQRKARGLFFDKRCTSIIDSPAELYLASRAIDLSLIGRVSNALGFHPAVLNTETGRELPAFIARVLNGAGQHVATHRTWIEPEPHGRLWRKATLDEPKKVLGSHVGHYIPLNKGECRETLAQIRPGVPIAVSEGKEDGLTAACAVPELRVLCAIAGANIANLPLPDAWIADSASVLTIIAQNDAPGSDGARTLEKVIEQLDRRGIRVAIARPDPAFKDANDVARATAQPQRMVG